MEISSDLAYPLAWPEGRERTPASQRQDSRFRLPFGAARDDLLLEIDRMGGIYPVISTNIPVRTDGLPRAQAREPDDPGVAVYFILNGDPLCLACDKWSKVRDNLRAIGKTIEYMRGLERMGSRETMERAVAGAGALPPASFEWRPIFGFSHDARVSLAEVRRAHRSMAREAHPDAGGSHAQMSKLNEALAAAEEELG